jgi:hypothetical protein
LGSKDLISDNTKNDVGLFRFEFRLEFVAYANADHCRAERSFGDDRAIIDMSFRAHEHLLNVHIRIPVPAERIIEPGIERWADPCAIPHLSYGWTSGVAVVKKGDRQAHTCVGLKSGKRWQMVLQRDRWRQRPDTADIDITKRRSRGGDFMTAGSGDQLQGYAFGQKIGKVELRRDLVGGFTWPPMFEIELEKFSGRTPMALIWTRKSPA